MKKTSNVVYRNYVLAAAIVLTGVFAALTIAIQPEILYGFEGDSGGAEGCGNGGQSGEGGEGNLGGGADCGRWVCRGGDAGCIWEPQACPTPPPPPPPPPEETTESTSTSTSEGSQPCYDASCTTEEEALQDDGGTAGFFGDNTSDESGGDQGVVIIGDEEPEVHPELSIVAVPLLVHPGESSTITWSSENTISCAVYGPNFTVEGIAGSDVAQNILNQHTYTLVCETEVGIRTASVTVSIVPQFQEI